MFSRDIKALIPEALHEESDKSAAPQKTVDKKDSAPHWDFQDMLDEDGSETQVADPATSAAAATAVAAPEAEAQPEVNDDNFGDMFAAAGLGGGGL